MIRSLAVANTEDWNQLADLGTALVLSAAIGVEREIRQKSAGLRTHTLVGVGAALFMLISKYGFSDVLKPGQVVLDPSRMAAQIVTGIGFLGAGLIFVRRDAVRGLTTAAAVWVTAAIGAAAGADLPLLAGFTTVMYFLVVLAFPPLGLPTPCPSPSPVGQCNFENPRSLSRWTGSSSRGPAERHGAWILGGRGGSGVSPGWN